MKINYANKTISLLKELHKEYPLQPISMHLALCFPDLLSFEGVSDKTFFTQLEEYKMQKDLDIIIPIDKYFDPSVYMEEEDEEEY